MKKAFFILLAFYSSFSFAQGLWSPRTSLPDSSRGYGIGFSIGNYGYVGLGANFTKHPYAYYRDFWQFNASTNSWVRKADFPGLARVCPAAFVIGNYAYVVTGQDTNINYLQECWRYDGVNNTWAQKANFPGSARAYDVGFAIGAKGYVGTGSKYNMDYCKDFWAYDTNTDAWTRIANFPPVTARFAACGFAVNGKGYVCFGSDSSVGVQNDIWEYDTGTNIWTRKTDNPGHPQCAVSGFVIGNKFHVGTGTNDIGTDYNQFWEYNTLTDTWASESYFPNPSRTLGCAFAISDTGYSGFGLDSTGLYFNNFYKFYPDSTLGIKSMSSNNEIVIFPNPFTSTCNVYLPINGSNISPIISLWDIEGRKVNPEIKVEDSYYIINRNNLPAGVYILSVAHRSNTYYTKLIIIN